MDLGTFIEKKLNQYAQAIIDGSDKRDEHALGELFFYMAMRRAISGDATLQDIGMLDAITDTLEELGIVEHGKKFYILPK